MIVDREGVNRALNRVRKVREAAPQFKRVTAKQVQMALQKMLINGDVMEIVVQDDRGGDGGFLMKVTKV